MYFLYESLFWIIVIIVLYVYFGYPLLLLILNKLCPAPKVKKAEITPTISLIIAAFNEEKVIAQKIKNTFELEYPKDNLEIIVVSDGSTDSTNEIVKAFSENRVKLVALKKNQGKSTAQNRAVDESNGEILLFSDADVMLKKDVVKKLINNFSNENVGCVVGEITYTNENDTSVREGEGLYWRYELFLREKESEVGNFAMGSGIMAIRQNLFQSLDPNVGEDFVLPLKTVINGFKVIFEPEAVTETIMDQISSTDMFRSKVRIISKDLRGLFLCREILNPFRYPSYAWGLISHKLLRWLVPYFLIVIFIINLSLLEQPFYLLTFIFQISFYTLAFGGFLWQKKSKSPRILGIPCSFCLVNFAALVGVFRFISGEKSGKWQPTRS